MKSTLSRTMATCWLTLAATLTAGQAQDDAAAAEQAPPGRLNVAVIDVGEIFNNHVRFKAMKVELKADVAPAEERVKTEQGEIKRKSEQLQGLLAGTRDYLDLQGEINKRLEELNTQVQLQKAEFLQREAREYHVIYQEIVREVAQYSTENGIEVVLRVGPAPEKAKSPQQILEDINKQVVWFAGSRDITPIILDRLNKKGQSPKPPAAKK